MCIPMETSAANCFSSSRRLLVLGFQGTLAPDPAHAAPPAAPHWTGHLSLEPWIATAQRDLDRRLASSPEICIGECFDPAALAEPLRDRLTGILTQALALHSDAQEEALLRRLPVLSALLRSAVAEWVDALIAFHRRFHRDAPGLATWLGRQPMPGITSIAPAASDAHAGGHFVLRLLFRDGACIFYKPRPVTGEWLWDHLVHAVNSHSALQFASARALPGANGRYGWVAALDPHPDLHSCSPGSTLAAAWWHAAGATLCLAAHARLTDLHLANIIATRHGPAPVDAESLGTPPLAAETLSLPEPARLLDNLLQTGLLPTQTPGNLPDVSGLFGKAAPVPGILIPHWSATPAGARQLHFLPAVLVDHRNAPPAASPLEVMPLLMSGYREAAEALLRCREMLTSSGSPWRRTLEQLHAPRIILRDTLTYSLLLSESLEARHLCSNRHRRNALLHALQSGSVQTLPASILRAELRDLLELHIPRFVALPGSRTLAAGSVRPLAHGFFSCSPAQAVLRGIGELSQQRLNDVHVPALQLAILQHAQHARAVPSVVGTP